MKISIPQSTVGTAGVKQVSVGQVKLGAVRIGLLSLNGLKVHARTGVAQMRNVRVVLTLMFSLDWTVGLVLDAGPLGMIDLSQSGTLDLGELELGIGFGNVGLPGLADLTLDIPKLPVTDLSAVIGALKDLKLGPVLAERIQAQGLVAPAAGFQLDGLGLSAASVQGIALDGATIHSATIGRVCGGTVPLAGLTIPSLAFPQVKVPRVSCRNVSADTSAEVTEMPEANAGLLKATLKVTTKAHFEVDELRLDGIKAAASIGEIALKNVELPYELLDLNLSQIGIERIAIPAVKVN